MSDGVQLDIQEAHSGGVTLLVQSSGVSMPVDPDTSGSVKIDIQLSAGMNRLYLSTEGPAGRKASPLTISEVSLLPIHGNDA